jgi:hypothetical protein
MRKLLPLLTLLFCLALLPLSSIAQCNGCGDGNEGAFTATSNTTIAGGVHNYTSFTIAPGVTVRATGSAPLEILVTGAVDIQGTLDVSGLPGADGVTYANGGLGALGVAGGGNGGNGSFASGTGPHDGGAASGLGAGAFGAGWSGGGGAGYAAIGGSSGGVGGAGGPVYGTAQITGNTAGSGGGGGSGGYDCGAGGGGAGGGFVKITSCVSITVSGAINANGGNGGSDGTGNCGGGGGGSGGSILLAAPTITNNGSLTANGGTGGGSAIPGSPYWGVGGAGSVGRIALETTTVTGGGVTVPAIGSTGPFTSGNAITLTTTGYDLSCFGGSNGVVTCAATGSNPQFSYQWSNGATGDSLLGLTEGCYTVTVTDSLGCTAVDTICLIAPPAIVIADSALNVLCNGDCNGAGMVTVTGGTPGYSYLWSSGDTTNTVANLCEGSYLAHVTDANGCIDSTTIIVTAPAVLGLSETHLDATTSTSNDGSATVTATGGTPGYTYLWTPGGATTATISNLGVGTYVAVVTDSNGCSDSISVVISFLIGVDGGEALQVDAFPNPTAGTLNLRAQLAVASPITLELVDGVGRLVMRQEFASTQTLQVPVDLSALADGVYHLRVATEAGTAVRRVTVQH